jgi:hypothetical protein
MVCADAAGLTRLFAMGQHTLSLNYNAGVDTYSMPSQIPFAQHHQLPETKLDDHLMVVQREICNHIPTAEELAAVVFEND